MLRLDAGASGPRAPMGSEHWVGRCTGRFESSTTFGSSEKIHASLITYATSCKSRDESMSFASFDMYVPKVAKFVKQAPVESDSIGFGRPPALI